MLFLFIVVMAIALIVMEFWHRKVAADDEKIFQATIAELNRQRAIALEGVLMERCAYWSGSSYLKCAPNPTGKCIECSHFKDLKELS